jgi:hypothetical protein
MEPKNYTTILMIHMNGIISLMIHEAVLLSMSCVKDPDLEKITAYISPIRILSIMLKYSFSLSMKVTTP